ncbi:site-specific integrase [Salinibacter ruber]|uniref:site-specific integrase n=1 Tax=Salinibacter ruber TaxID=146919 RepID=UPI003C6E0C70
MPDAPDQSPKLLDQVRQTCRRRQYSYHTEKAYVRWAERFACVHDTAHPRRLNENDIRAFLGHLASGRNVAASTSGTERAARIGRRCCPSASTARSGAT